MVDKKILAALRDLKKASSSMKTAGKLDAAYKKGLVDASRAAVEICESIIKAAGKKLD